MYISELREKEYAEYDKIVKSEGTVFNSLEWLRIFGAKVKIFGVFDKGDELIGGFHFYQSNFLFWRFLRNPPFTPYAGPFFKNYSRNTASRFNLQRKFSTCLADFLSDHRFILVYLALSRPWIDVLPFFWKKYHITPNFTYLVDLEKSEDQLLADMTSERRNDIRKAAADGLVVRRVDDYRVIRELVKKTFSRNQKSLPIEMVDRILFSYARPNNSFAVVTYAKDEPIAGCFCLFDDKSAYYLLSGYDHGKKHHGAGAWALWESIRIAKTMGLKQFDFEGSMIETIERYIRGFGPSLSSYYRVSKSRFLLECIIKLKFRNYF
jgi:hypothetical protein